MNNTVSWLLLSRNTTADLLPRVLWNTAGIQMNSDLVAAIETTDHRGVFNLFDIYSKGRHLCKDIFQTLLGTWSADVGFRLTPNYSPYKIRQNFNFLQLRGVTVIDRENVTSGKVDQLLGEPGLTKGIVAFVKYHYALLVVLRDFHNFTIKFRPTRGWAGRLRSGYRLGLLGVVQRHETDVAATGIIMRLSRQPELDSIHYSWAFETGFIYKITPDIGSKSEGNGFVAPFSLPVWVALLLSLALSVLVLQYLARLSADERNTRATMAYVLDVMACVAQQGVPNVSRLVPTRVAVIVLLVANLVLYNYYTSTVVSGLLSSQMIGPETIAQVIDSPLLLSLTDTGYHRILLREQTLPYSTRMHERKALPPRSPNDLPLFTDVEHAVPYLRRGGHVLHCELTEVYPAIANQFTANEICELRTVEGLYRYDIRVMAFVLPKHSMYSELFKITLGFIFRLTPELNGATRETSYLSPFTDTTWYSVASVLALVLGVLQCIAIFHAELSSLARNHYLIDTIGLIAQQGTAQSSAYISLRIVLYAVLIMAFLLYNYYTASIVGELLSCSNQGPATIDQLLNAPLAVMFANDSYNRALAVDNGTGGLMQHYILYEQQHARVPDAMTSDRIYADVRTAVQLLKLGGYAFHCELTEAFRAIASHFDAHEICELRTMKGLYTELPLMSFVVPQGSMYAEQFKITLTRATEIGLIKRLLKTYSSDQPTCLGGPLVHPVVLAGVTAPFTILAAGFVSSFVIFLLEKIIYSMKTMSQPY
ncbi:ionotropic receptor 75a [Anopheles gambiae]|uniref:ionotropic receptor 75a n=1 Tax=Anopheles gambiae TaxID=7165 RepID=UPI002AC9B54F|nr:ionotropic receptor 75a [Anopheles gambiae]